MKMKNSFGVFVLTVYLQLSAVVHIGSFAEDQFPRESHPQNFDGIVANPDVKYRKADIGVLANPNAAPEFGNQLSDLEKRHLSSVLNKRHVSSLIKCRTVLCKAQPDNGENNPEMTSQDEQLNPRNNGIFNWDYLNWLFGNVDENSVPAKRFFPTRNLDNDYAERNLPEEKRHVGSLLYDEKRHVGSLLHDEKRHLASVLKNQKRHLSSVIQDQKRHFSSLLPEESASVHGSRRASDFFPSSNIYGVDSSSNFDEHYKSPEMRNTASEEESSLKQLEKPSDFKKDTLTRFTNDQPDKPIYSDQFDTGYFGSLLNNKNDLKRHLSSILKQNRLPKRKEGMSYLPMKEVSENMPPQAVDLAEPYKRHFASILKNSPPMRTKRDALNSKESQHDVIPLPIRLREEEEMISTKDHAHEKHNIDDVDHTADGAVGMKGSNVTREKFLIRKKRYVGSLAREDDFPFRSTSFILSNNPGSSRSMQVIRPLPNSEIEGYERPDIYPSEAVGFFPPPQKKFLGSLARQGWFPRQYRSFAEPTVQNRRSNSPRSSNGIVLYRDAGLPLSRSDDYGGSNLYVSNGYMG